MNRKLASIQQILDVSPIAGADQIEVCSVLGWKCVAKKGEFKVGDLCCYVEIDSLIPYAPWSEFLWKSKDEVDKPHRLRTVRLRGQISQGLILPGSVLVGKKFPTDKRPDPHYDFPVGAEVTGLLGIQKYEPPIPVQLAGQVKGQFPCFLQKTDETRIQAAPDVLQEIAGKPIYITTKMDGSSGTFYWNRGDFGVCSRNLEFKEDADNTFWKLARKYELAGKLFKLGRNLAIQGEVCGPGIQKNRMGLQDHDLFIFNVYDIDKGEYLDFQDWVPLIKGMEVPTVPLVTIMDAPADWTVEKLLELAKGQYPGTTEPREGIVIRPLRECHSAALKGRLSFKVINNDFLLKGGD